MISHTSHSYVAQPLILFEVKMHVTKLIIIPVAVFTAAAAAAPQLRIGPWRKINRPVKAELESQIDLSDMKGHTVDKREAKRPGDRWGYNEVSLMSLIWHIIGEPSS